MITLRPGSKGDLVRKWQEGLAFLGYAVKPDGDYGANTEAHTEAYQSTLKLYADGIAGQSTIAAFNEDMKARGPAADKYRIPFLAEPADPDEDRSAKLKWAKCPADKFEDRGG